MSEFTRLTVTGSSKRADVAAPADEPIGMLLPQLMEMLGEPVGTVARPLTLVAPDGEPVDLDRSLEKQGLMDGVALRLVRVDASPPPPAVIDLTDAVADAHDARADRWDGRARRATGSVLVAVSTVVAATALPLGDAAVRLGVHGAIAGALLIAAVAFGLSARVPIAAVFASAAAGASAVIGVDAAALAGDGPIIGVAAAMLALSATLLLGRGIGCRDRGAITGGAVGAGLSGALLLLELSPLSSPQSAAIVGVIAVLLLGLLPWVALSTAGLTGLDQLAADGGTLERGRALTSVDEAYRALTWTVVGVSAPLAVCGAVLMADGSLWTVLLGASVLLVTLLRSRAFPLRAQGLLLWAAGIVVLLSAVPTALSALGASWILATAAIMIAVVAAIGALVEPRAHQRARLRAFGNGLELIAVVALVPLAVGVFGVYADLLGLFGGGA